MASLDISIVSPTRNEVKNVPILVREIAKVLKKEKLKGELIIVDDSSPDGTGAEVKRLSKKYKFIKLISKPFGMDLGDKYKVGFAAARGKVIVSIDSDLAEPPELIPKLLEKLDEGYDVVIGSKYAPGGGTPGWSPLRRLQSGVANLMARVLLGIKVRDMTCAFRAYKREALQKIDIPTVKSSGYSFMQETLFRATRADLKIAEIPFTLQDRKFGESKLGRKEIFRFLETVGRLFVERLTS
ncbi:MAG TPA: polyprenol monophosphomannose synthase [Candidatus Norongarragalinales archaeon]|jgi:glycosyltransferase involved in cell wall biosynthesis|nr:polyprenol monophosphomannose synthase [Candidatus Norongarragalinales archaeon]